ncbi:MAG: response regulator [Desulfobacteraceae bacterium]|nr:response regulator [Desulfobacteraceae bacterium]
MKNILIVDDDIALLKMIAKKFETGSDGFNPVFVKDGVSAVNQIKNKKIDIVVSDLQMPKMDGYGLLEYINANYPDIPVIIITAFGKPKSKTILLENGAAGYFEKPVNLDLLISEIKKLIEKESDGGILKSASLEMFTQLVEMEQKTCTIRVKREDNDQEGVLFFKEGEIYHARIGNLKGLEAAYRIFSWHNVTLCIENDCRIKKKKINSDLQAVLLEAMRLKDEKDDIQDNDAEGEGKAGEKAVLKDSESSKISPVNYLKKFIANNSSDITGILDIYEDPKWTEFIKKASELGTFLNTGSLKACYVNMVDSTSLIIVPDEENTVLSVSSKCDREKIYRILMD